jgi:serine/threonine-protein kinase RsbW
MTDRQNENGHRVLGRVDRDEFVGRAEELKRIVAHPQRGGASGLLLLLAPAAGVSELLRQAYDELFNQRSKTIPIYFALPREETTAVSIAISFLNTFLLQYVAFRRDEPALCQSSLTLNELLGLAPPADYDWMEQLVESYNRERFGNEDGGLIRWCLSAPQRVPVTHGRPFVMIDAVALSDRTDNGPALGTELILAFGRSELPYAIAGLRRQMLDTIYAVQSDFEGIETLRLDKLSDDDGRALVERVAHKLNVPLSEEVRDLLVQQFECSPFFITNFLQAASDLSLSMTTYLACEQLYVDELMGGRFHRYFTTLLEDLAPDPATRRAIIRMLYETSLPENRKASFETWTKNLHLEVNELEQVLRALHVQEFITRDGGLILAGGGSVAWKDYMETRYRLEMAGEPRALVVADTIMESLKRAPHTMARYYRRVAAVGLRRVLADFDCQRVPAILFDYARFSASYKGTTPEEVDAGLEADTELFRLPQVVHVASCASFSLEARQLCDEERCVVAHGFTGGKYTDTTEVVWLAAEIDSKLEVESDIARRWYEQLEAVALQSGFRSARIWLIAREGFSPEASEFLGKAGAHGSSRQQLELLMAQLNEKPVPVNATVGSEFEMVVPMGGDNELIAAHTVAEIARRLTFQAGAVNQIKHALIEACINASEHSLSPERKIYQRFRVEDDKLIITISSRGIVPFSIDMESGAGDSVGSAASNTPANRRGLGLSIIRTLMDEVEFERTDDGTRLRMTKYLRKE